MPKMPPLRKTTMPRETILKATRGSPAYRGHTVNLIVGGEEVCIMSRTLNQLEKVFAVLRPGEKLRRDGCFEVVIVSVDNVELDDEL